MASYNTPILIQKLDVDTEKWNNIYLTEKAEKDKNPFIHANINKASGKEYFNASTNISASTYNFKIRYCEKLKELLFNTEIYRVVYENRCYDIKNIDR